MGKRKTQEKLAADKAAAADAARKANKDKRVAMYKSAEKYVKEYRNMAKQRVRMHRQAKAAGNHFVDAEAKLAFVVRTRQARHRLHGGSCARDLHCGSPLQGGQQLPVAIQAPPSQGWSGQEAQGLLRGWPSG